MRIPNKIAAYRLSTEAKWVLGPVARFAVGLSPKSEWDTKVVTNPIVTSHFSTPNFLCSLVFQYIAHLAISPL